MGAIVQILGCDAAQAVTGRTMKASLKKWGMGVDN